jgi:hypothetical protein
MKELFLSAVLVVASTTATLSQELLCMPRNEMFSYLSELDGQTVVASGVSADGLMMELYVSETGSWSAVMTTPTMISCIVESGNDMHVAVPKPGDPA